VEGSAENPSYFYSHQMEVDTTASVITTEKNAVSKETGRIGENLYYGFYCFPAHKGNLRYVFYRNSSLREVESNEVTLVYIEGNVTMEELKKMFKK
jgi:hypothetical protein